jgi:O-antigen/teichoic acid export membrane protein
MAGRLITSLTHPLTLSLAIKMVGAALSFAVTFLVARLFGAAISGEYAMAAQTVLTASAIALFGNDQLLVRRMAGDASAGRQDLARAALVHAVRIVGIASVVAAAAVLVFSPLATAIGASPVTMRLTVIGILVFPMLCLAVAAMRAMGQVVRSQFFYGTMQSLLLAGLLLLSLGLGHYFTVGMTARSITLIHMVSLTITSALACWLVWRVARRWASSRGEDTPSYRLADSAPIGLTVGTHMLANWLAFALIGSMLGLVEVGAFRVCIQLITIVTLIFTTYDSVVSAQFAADFRQSDLAAARRRHIRSIAILGVFAGPVLLAAILFPAPVLALFGPEFIVASQCLAILAAGQAINIVTGPVGTMLVMAGREKVNLSLAVAGLAVMLGLFALLVPTMGLTGAAIAVSASLAVRNLASFVLVWRITSGAP